MCQSKHENRHILRFADDTVVVSLPHNNESGHGPVMKDFISWCDDSFLELNISKTKDMIIDFRMHAPTHDPTTIKGQPVDWVDSYKYLGTVNDSKLTFTRNCKALCKKGHQRLACLRKPSCFYIDKKMLTLFYPRCSGKPGLLVKTVPTLYGGNSSSFIQVVGSRPLRVKQQRYRKRHMLISVAHRGQPFALCCS